MWMTGTYDPELNLLYVGTGNPTPVLNGPARPGDNKWTVQHRRAQSRHRQAGVGLPGVAARHARLGRGRSAGARRRDVRRRAAQAAAAGVAQRLLLRARSHERQEPADHAVRGRELGEGHRQGRPPDPEPRQGAGARRPARRARRGRRHQLSLAELRSARPACSSSARTTRTASISSSRSTARTAGRAPTTASTAAACCGRSTTRPARSAGATTSAAAPGAPAC